MNTNAKTFNQNDTMHTLMTLLLAFALLMGSMTLVGCGGSKDEQDNCYGEDMPVVNE